MRKIEAMLMRLPIGSGTERITGAIIKSERTKGKLGSLESKWKHLLGVATFRVNLLTCSR